MAWGEAVGFLREKHDRFRALLEVLEASVRSDHLALLRLAFQAAQPYEIVQGEMGEWSLRIRVVDRESSIDMRDGFFSRTLLLLLLPQTRRGAVVGAHERRGGAA